MTQILNAHGSKNDIFLAGIRPDDFESDSELRAFVRHLCDRDGALGGDGIYFYDAGPAVPEAWFFNPDGSSAEFCGNGMRCLGRVVLDLRQAQTAVIRSGDREYTVHRGATTAEGVRQIRLEHPAVDFAPSAPIAAGPNPLQQVPLPALDPVLTFTAVAVPNPHLIAEVDKYVESDLVAMGETIAARADLFPAGANLSVLLPVAGDDVFVRTYERGAGLTAACGSGMVAARAVYSRLGRSDPADPVLIRNVGGMATSWLSASGEQWYPVLEGNATYVYDADVDIRALVEATRAAVDRQDYADELAAYRARDEQNLARLRAVGIEIA